MDLKVKRDIALRPKKGSGTACIVIGSAVHRVRVIFIFSVMMTLLVCQSGQIGGVGLVQAAEVSIPAVGGGASSVGSGSSARSIPDPVHGGLFYERFRLTLDPGWREEALGPLFYHQESGPVSTWAVPPLISVHRDSEIDSEEIDVVYPLLTYDRYGTEKRWQVLQWLNFSGGTSVQSEDHDKRRFTLFPFYFQQRSSEPTNNYTAFIPFYGTLKNRFFRDEVHFVLMPLYVQSRKRDVVTDNLPYPFVHWRHGDGLKGWQLWPLVGSETKKVTEKTNSWGDVEMIPGHEKWFTAWPFILRQKMGIGTTNVQSSFAFLPLFARQQSPLRSSFSAPWPLGLTVTRDDEKGYREIGFPWPLVVYAHGPGKKAARIFPLFSRASTDTLKTDFYLWPLYKSREIHSAPYERQRRRIGLFLYSDLTERNTETGEKRRRTDFWPLWSYRKEMDGKSRLQVLAPLEPFLPVSRGVERNYSPLWSLWREEENPVTHDRSQSLLWNLWRREVGVESRKFSLLFGLFQYQSGPEGRRVRWFHWGERRSGVAGAGVGVGVGRMEGSGPMRSGWSMKPPVNLLGSDGAWGSGPVSGVEEISVVEGRDGWVGFWMDKD